MGTSTYWVDVVDKKPEVPEDGFVMDFNMDDDTSSTGSVTNTFFCLVLWYLRSPAVAMLEQLREFQAKIDGQRVKHTFLKKKFIANKFIYKLHIKWPQKLWR